MNKFIYRVCVVVFGVLLVGSPSLVRAQVDGTTTETSSDVTASSATSGEAEASDEVSGWGLFFLGIRERVSLLTTFDPVKKAEKALKFAEERTRIAEKMAEKTDDPKVQARLDRVIKRAGELEERADSVKEKLLENPDARAKLLLKNLINFKEHREEFFSKLEKKLTPEQLERVENMRLQAEQKRQELLNSLENSTIPEEVREHLKEVKARIEDHVEEVQEFRNEQKVLLDRIKSGDDSAKEELQTLREDRRTEIKINIEERKEGREELKQKIKEREKADDSSEDVRKSERIEKRTEAREEEREEDESGRGQKQLRPILPLQERPQN